MEATQKCQNCGKDFPESKINSHFSYCRRNIKKCEQCGDMVDINYLEDHNADFHTKQACKFCRKQFNTQELTKHEGVCTAKPKYCEFCENSIAVNEFDRHVSSCGARTKLCYLCEKNVILRDYDVHSVTCTGKTVQQPPPVETVLRGFQKKPSEGRREQPSQLPSYGQPKPDPYSHKPERQEVPATNVRRHEPSARQDPVIRHDPTVPTNPTRSSQLPSNPIAPTRGGYTNTQTTGPARIESRGKEVRKQTKPQERKQIYQPAQNERSTQPTNQQRVPVTRPQPPRQEQRYDQIRQDPTRQDPTRLPGRREQQPASNPLYEQQKQFLREQQRQRHHKPQQPSPIYEPAPYRAPDVEPPQEDAELQKAIYESMGYNRLGGQMKNLDLGGDQMSQSFYRDLQLQEQIESNIKAQPRAGRR